MQKAEDWQALGREILSAARTEISLYLPFTVSALDGLALSDEAATDSLATDLHKLYYNGAWLGQQYERGRNTVCRAYLHTVFHCLLGHIGKTRGRMRPLWDLCCDMAVENMLDSLDYACLKADTPQVQRAHAYRKWGEGLPVLTAEGLYRNMSRDKIGQYELATLSRLFLVDDHDLWPDTPQQQDEQSWQHKASAVQTAMDTVFAGQATGGNAMREQLQVAARPAANYRSFLRRFTALREQVQIDADSFDYGYYAYGLRTFGNMPLIEPLETREVRRVEELVIVIDTSMSTSGELVKRFLAYTYGILQDGESFFRQFHLRILQCDDEVRQDTAVHNAAELLAYQQNFTLIGQSATDFRPAFAYVEDLVRKKTFRRLRGLLYFTDGLGIYPKRRPSYDAAFVMLEGQCYPDKLPPWAIRVILREQEMTQDGEAAAIIETK